MTAPLSLRGIALDAILREIAEDERAAMEFDARQEGRLAQAADERAAEGVRLARRMFADAFPDVDVDAFCRRVGL